MPDPGWYEDPGQPGLRWWDGERWTTDTAPLDVGADATPATAGMLGAPTPDPGPEHRPTGARAPVLVGVTAAVVVVAVVVALVVAGTGHHHPHHANGVTTPATAPNVTTTTTTSTAPTATTVPGASGDFVSTVETGPHAVTGYGGHASTLLGFGRTACAVLATKAPAAVAWYGAITPSANGTTAVPPLAGAPLVDAAARYLCPQPALVSRADHLAHRVATLPVAFRRGGVLAADDEAAAGLTAYACDLFVTGSDAPAVTGDLRRALAAHRYALSGHQAGLAASVGIQVACPAHLPTWLRTAGGRNL